MNGTSFDAFARRAVATLSRRASLSALGAAALGAVVFSDRAEAGCRKKCNKRCAAQRPNEVRHCHPDEVAASATCLVSCWP